MLLWMLLFNSVRELSPHLKFPVCPVVKNLILINSVFLLNALSSKVDSKF